MESLILIESKYRNDRKLSFYRKGEKGFKNVWGGGRAINISLSD